MLTERQIFLAAYGCCYPNRDSTTMEGMREVIEALVLPEKTDSCNLVEMINYIKKSIKKSK